VSETLSLVLQAIAAGDVRVSDHGYDELAADGLLAREVLDGVQEAKMVEDYPDSARGPSVLVLQRDRAGRPVHVLWGMPKGKATHAVLVTAYRPDPARWSDDFMRRKK
jgi:hypothetical protein